MTLEQSLNLTSGSEAFDMIETAIMLTVANSTGFYIRNLKPDGARAIYELHVPYQESWLMGWGTLDYQTALHTPSHLYAANVEAWLIAHRAQLISGWEHPSQKCIDKETGKEVDCE